MIQPGDRVGAAVSGGIDSVALFRLLLELRSELGIVLSIVHFNHKLRGAESDADQEFVAGLAREHDLEFHYDSDDVALYAAGEHVSVETAARELRYGFFRYLLGEDADPSGLKSGSIRGNDGTAGSHALLKPISVHLNKIVTGHTLDDQAETVLMRIIRGSGLRGLGGIHPRIAVEEDDADTSGEIVRPLLTTRRRELERYLADIDQSWREDSTNAEDHFTRNRLRKLVVPLLEKEFNPAVAENLAELAEIARGEEDYWENEVAGWMGTGVHWSQPEWAEAAFSHDGLVQIAAATQAQDHAGRDGVGGLRSKIESSPWLVMNASVDRLWFLSEPLAVQRRLVKAIGTEAKIPLEFKHVEAILRFALAKADSGKRLSLPLGWKVEREHDQLVFVTPDLRGGLPVESYEHELLVPGQTEVVEIGIAFEARRVPAAEAAAYNPDDLLDPDLVTGRLTVRNWRPGDRFWPVHTKSPKKIKELLQERRIPQSERHLWPVVTVGEEIAWVKGFPVSVKIQSKAGCDVILITERPLPQ